mmetsp:Transcript_1047/g.1483  ORF Transcript_1047/g.1483 Transcript_1047/m.1483 type:complete len:194 (+) Transcript_1047:51-632(+)
MALRSFISTGRAFNKKAIPLSRLADRSPSLKSLTHPSRYMHVEKRIKDLGFDLPKKTVEPKGNYIICTRTGNLIFVAGHIPQKTDGELITGKLGLDMSIEEGYAAAQLSALNIVATLKAELGDLDRVKKVVKVLGFVSCTDDFTDQVKIINGASDLFGQVFQEKGIHARAAVGTNSLPLSIPVEIEAIVEVED